MKWFMTIGIMASFSVNACLINFKINKTWQEEQKKGTLKTITTLNEEHSIDASSVIRFSFINKEETITLYFSNSTELVLDYNEAVFKDIQTKLNRCKG